MSSKVYELRFYTFNLKGKADFKKLHEDREFWKLRQSFSTVLGIWETYLNGATEFFHIVEYDDVEDLLRVRQELAASKEFGPKIQPLAEQYGTFHNRLAILSANTPQLCTRFDPSPTAVYELQTMKCKDSIPTLGDKGVLVGRFSTLYGPVNTEYRLIRFPDAKSAEAAARERMTKDDEMKGMSESRLLVPLPVSDLQ